MQLEATLNLEELTAAEIAQFEMKCRKKKASPEKQAAKLIRDFISIPHSTPPRRAKSKTGGRKVA